MKEASTGFKLVIESAINDDNWQQAVNELKIITLCNITEWFQPVHPAETSLIKPKFPVSELNATSIILTYFVILFRGTGKSIYCGFIPYLQFAWNSHVKNGKNGESETFGGTVSYRTKTAKAGECNGIGCQKKTGSLVDSGYTD